MQPEPTRRRRAIVAAVLALALAAAGVAAGIALPPLLSGAATSSAPVAAPTATPAPLARAYDAAPTGAPRNTQNYDLGALPPITVFAVVDALPVDIVPTAPLSGDMVRAVDAGAPVFADPTGQPVGVLAHDFRYGGTTLPVIERQRYWVHVLLPGRKAAPSPGQLTGWLRATDVTFSHLDQSIQVDLAARTIDIVSPTGSERVTTVFGSGRPDTPTPLGRTFVMVTQVTSLAYTRGHPVTYLGAQSSTLAGFDGSSVAVTAFHYIDAHSGAISNGCLRLDAAAADRIAQLPEGTPVIIRG